MAKISGIDIPELTFQEGSAPTTPASTKWKVYAKTDGLYFMDDAGTETGPLVDSGSGGIAYGTAFPGTPSTGDLFHRTDLSPAIYRYDGTRWLCTCPHHETMGQGDVLDNGGTDTGPYRRLALPTTDIYVTQWKIVTQVSSPNDGTRYWTVTLRNVAAGAFASSNVASFNTSADTQAQAVRHDQTVNAAITVSGRAFLDVIAVKTSTPGGIRLPCSVAYHFIAT